VGLELRSAAPGRMTRRDFGIRFGANLSRKISSRGGLPRNGTWDRARPPRIKACREVSQRAVESPEAPSHSTAML
jgi:hypothetical protein